MRFRVTHLLVVMCLAAVLGIALRPISQGICDGWYDLTISVAPSTAIGVEGLSYLPLGKEQLANEVVLRLNDYLSEFRQQDSVAPFVIAVGYSFRVDAYGQVSKGSQEYSHVIVVLHLKNGSRAVHLVEIPHRKEAEHVEVNKGNRSM